MVASGLGAKMAVPLRSRPQEIHWPFAPLPLAQKAHGVQEGPRGGRALDLQNGQHPRHIAAEAVIAGTDVAEGLGRKGVGEAASSGDEGAEAVASGMGGDDRIEGRPVIERPQQRRAHLGEGFQRVARGRSGIGHLGVAEPLGRAVELADDAVVGFHHGIGQGRLPLDHADGENGEPPRLGNVAHSVGEVAFTLSAQAADPRGRDTGEQVDRQRQILKPGQPVQQAVGGGRVRVRLELPQPDEARQATVHRLLQHRQKPLPQHSLHAVGDAGLDPAFGLDQRVGAEPLDGGDRGQDRSGPAALGDEALRKLVA